MRPHVFEDRALHGRSHGTVEACRDLNGVCSRCGDFDDAALGSAYILDTTISTPEEQSMKRFAILAATLGAVFATFAATSVAAGALPTLTIALTKNTVTVGGAKVSGAVNIVSTVSGEASDGPGLILLKPGVTPQEFGKVVSHFGPNSPFDAIDPYGTIVFDGSAVQGSATSAQAVLVPGTYIAVNNGNGFTPFTVTASAHPASLPKPAATVSTIDFGFRGASTLRDGELLRFKNDGYLIHMFADAQVASVATAKKVEALLLAGKMKQAKKYVVAPPSPFAGPLSSGSMQQEVITQPPGVYVILCLMNTEDGREHFQLGMFKTIKIVK